MAFDKNNPLWSGLSKYNNPEPCVCVIKTPSGYRPATSDDFGGGGGGTGPSGSSQVVGLQPDNTPVATGSNYPVLFAGVTADPASLPADTVSGRVKEILVDLKGIQFDRTPDLDRSYDSTTNWAESVTLVNNSATATSLSIRTSAGVVTSVEGVINASGARYIQLHDVNGTPAGAAVPFAVCYVPGGISNFAFNIPRNGYPVTNGCTLVESNTLATYTVTSATEVFATATHRGA